MHVVRPLLHDWQVLTRDESFESFQTANCPLHTYFVYTEHVVADRTAAREVSCKCEARAV